MNIIQKTLLSLLALTGISSGLVAYEFDFMNTTQEMVVLKFNTRSAANVDRYAIIPPGGSTKFPVANADCFLRAAWAPYKEKDGWGNKIPYKGGLDLVNKKPDPKNPKRAIGRIEGNDSKGNDKQRLFGDQIAPAYSFYRMDVVMVPSEVFNKTVEAAEKLTSGIDNAICQIMNEVKAFMPAEAAKKIIESAVGGNTNNDSKSMTDSTLLNTSMDISPGIDFNFGNTISSPTPAQGSKAPLKSPENCEFGLAKIAGAAGELVKIGMCQARQFMIAYTAKPDKLDEMQFEGFSNVPKLQLITGAGE